MTPEKQPSVDAKLNHSGNLPDESMRETPINEFDNTTLAEAVEQGYIPENSVPDNAAGFIPSTELPESSKLESTSSHGHTRLIAGIALGTVVLGGGGTVAAIATSHSHSAVSTKNNADTKKDTTTIKKPTTSKVSPSTVPSGNETSIPIALKASDTPTQQAIDLTKDLSNWGVAGATPQAFKELYTPDSDGDTPKDTDLSAQIAAKQAPAFEKALLGTSDTSEMTSEQLTFANNFQARNATDITAYLGTVDKKDNSENIHPFSSSIDFQKLTSGTQHSDGTETLIFTAVEHEQLDNRVGQTYKNDPSLNYNGQVDNIIAVLKPVGDNEILQSIDIEKQ